MKILVLSYNHPEITSKTVKSALRFLAPQNILLVHNGSQIQHQRKLQSEFPDVEHLVLEANKGFTGGANAGLRKAFSQKTNWVLFLTNDCELIQMGHPPAPASLAAPLIWRRKKGHIDSLGGKLNLKKAHLRHCQNSEDFYSENDSSYIPGTAFWIHRDIFRDFSFNENLGTYWEDVDLSLRLKKSGHKLQLAPQTEIIHAVGKTCHKDVFYTTYLFQRNRKKVCLYHAPLKQKIQVRWHLSKTWTQTAFRLGLKKDWKKLATLWQAIKD